MKTRTRIHWGFALGLAVAAPAWGLSPEFAGEWFTFTNPSNSVTIEEAVTGGIDAAMNATGIGLGNGQALLTCKEILVDQQLPRLHCDGAANAPAQLTVEVELQSDTQAVFRIVADSQKPPPTLASPVQLSKRGNTQVPASSHTGLAPEFLKTWAYSQGEAFDYHILVEESLATAPALVVSGRLFYAGRANQLFSHCTPSDGSKTRVFCSDLLNPIQESDVAGLTAMPASPVYYLSVLSKSFMEQQSLVSVGGTGGPVWNTIEMVAVQQ